MPTPSPRTAALIAQARAKLCDPASTTYTPPSYTIASGRAKRASTVPAKRAPFAFPLRNPTKRVTITVAWRNGPVPWVEVGTALGPVLVPGHLTVAELVLRLSGRG